MYESLFQDPRITKWDIGLQLGLSNKTALKRVQEAFDGQYVVGPHICKKAYRNLKEYVYLVECENPEMLYLEYQENMNVIYHAEMVGFCNLFVVTRKEIQIDGDILVEGYRSDYCFPYAPDRSWEESIDIMWRKMENFNPEIYEQLGYIKTHFDQTIEWDSEDEALYRYFKYNLRKKLSPVMKEHLISGGKLYNWFERLPECCSIYTGYYPETMSAYDPCLFMVETDYKDFIVDLFSELPTTSTLFTVSDKVLLFVHIPKLYTSGISFKGTAKKLYIPLLLNELRKREIIESKARAIVEYYWTKDI